MHLTFRNVTDAFTGLVKMFHTGYPVPIVRRPTRNGSVLQIDEPVTITYTHPKERVLLNPSRDCNPAFHIYEALWMLAGRNDVAPLAYYAKQMKNYSDDGKTLNGAYGYRWRHAMAFYPPGSGNKSDVDAICEDGVDQLDLLVNHLKTDPTSRRAVLQMWNVEDDLLKIGTKPRDYSDSKKGLIRETPGKHIDYYDHSPASKDVCCNLSVMFSMREFRLDQSSNRPDQQFLDMTVTNRSNDLVWGMLGANYVHFTILQEYIAARLGAEVGRYHHFSNNVHVYDDPTNPKVSPWKPAEWMAADRTEYHEPADGYTTVPLVKDPEAFERELSVFVEHFSGKGQQPVMLGNWSEPFFRTVAEPMLTSFRCHKIGDPRNAAEYAEKIADDAWRVACEGWLQRRAK